MDLDIEDFEDTPSLLPFNTLIPPDNLPNKDYHQSDGISASGLKQAWKDPKLYHLRSKLKRLQTYALVLGIATHEAVLEPKNFDIKKYEYDLIPSYLKKLDVMINNAKVMFDYLFKDTINEHSLFVKDEGFTRKVRPDAYDEKNGVIYDLKTCAYNNPSRFVKDAYDYGYHLQASFYIDTMRIAGYKVKSFCFLCVPSETPCEPFAFQVSNDFVEDGRDSHTDALQKVLDYKKPENKNKVYFNTLDLPRWRKNQILGEDNENS